MCAATPSYTPDSGQGLTAETRQIFQALVGDRVSEAKADKSGKTGSGQIVNLLRFAQGETITPDKKVNAEALRVVKALEELKGILEGGTAASTLSFGDLALITKVISAVNDASSATRKVTVQAMVIKVAAQAMLILGPTAGPQIQETIARINELGTPRLEAFAAKQQQLVERQNNGQLAKAPNLQATAPLFQAGITLSLSSDIAIPRRLELGLHRPGETTASTNFRLRAATMPHPPATATEAEAVLATSEKVETQTVAILKSASQGYCGENNILTTYKDDGSIDVSGINIYGLPPGGEVQGECLTRRTSDITGVPTNAPNTIALRVSHPSLGKPDPDLSSLSLRGFNVSEETCLELIHSCGNDRQAFNTLLTNQLVDQTYAQVSEAFIDIGIDLPPHLRDDIVSVLTTSPNAQIFQEQMGHMIAGELARTLGTGPIEIPTHVDITINGLTFMIRGGAPERDIHDMLTAAIMGASEGANLDHLLQFCLLEYNRPKPSMLNKLQRHLRVGSSSPPRESPRPTTLAQLKEALQSGNIVLKDLEALTEIVNNKRLEVLTATFRGLIPASLTDEDKAKWNAALAPFGGEGRNIRDFLSRMAALPKTASTIFSRTKLNELNLQTEGRWNDLYDKTLNPAAPATESHLCSVQEWIPDSTPLSHLSREEQDEISPLAYARLGLNAGMTMQTDQNPGNILTTVVTRAALAEKLNNALPGHSERIQERWYAPAVRITVLPERERTLAVHQLGNEIMSGVASNNPAFGQLSKKAQLEIEYDTHQMLHMLAFGKESFRDCHPIDNANSFPDLTIRGAVPIEAANNAWILEDSAMITPLPNLLREHLGTLNFQEDVLPELRNEQKQLHAMAKGNEVAGMRWTPAQENLFLLSNRILRVGAQQNKTMFEMGLMKDNLQVNDLTKKKMVDCPMRKLFDKYCMNDGKPIPLERIDWKAVDSDIKSEFKKINKRVGTVDDGFQKWTQQSDLEMAREQLYDTQYVRS